jgi:hypothetical protein
VSRDNQRTLPLRERAQHLKTLTVCDNRFFNKRREVHLNGKTEIAKMSSGWGGNNDPVNTLQGEYVEKPNQTFGIGNREGTRHPFSSARISLSETR